MNTVTVIASPRHDGNCKKIVDKITEGIIENGGRNQIYFMDELNIKHCIACKKCKDLEHPTKCIIDDDFRMIMDKVESGCALIFAAPNYFGEINSLGHLFMERFYSMTKTTPNRLDGTGKAIVIHTYGARNGYYDEYINKRARLFESIGLNVVAVLSVGENLPSKGDNTEILRKAKEIGLKL
jgi:multimeric flavodoxin WrbA